MPRPKVRRRWIAGAVLLIAVVGVVRGVGQGTRLDYYRIIDDRTVVVGTTGGPWEWLRVTGVTETTASVIIEASALDAPLPGFRDKVTRQPLRSACCYSSGSKRAVKWRRAGGSRTIRMPRSSDARSAT